jgi:hypothetical protein
MARRLLGQEISMVQIVDDDASARKAMVFTVNDADFEGLPEEGPLPNLDAFVQGVRRGADAIVCDHRMKGQYAAFNGAEAVARLYKVSYPAILCTRWTKADIDAMRQYIRYIPSLISADEVSPDSIAAGFLQCIREFKNDPVPSRKPWRTLIHVESVESQLNPALFYISIPGWDSKEIVRLPLDLIPAQHRAKVQPGARFFAETNKGTERAERLFFSDFEFPGRRGR